MPKSKIQFQRGLSLPAFLARYGTEAQCRHAVFRWRWPLGFVCSECASHSYCTLRSRPLLQCNRCHHQTSLTSGTLLAATKLPLRTWFLAIYLLTQNKNGISALELSRHLGVSYNTAWALKHKLLQAMKERDDAYPLGGRVELDDAYWGGQRSGGKTGRGSPGKTPFVAAVATDEQARPLRMRLSRVKGFTSKEIARWSSTHLRPETLVVSDGLKCFAAVTTAQCAHQRIITGSGAVSVQQPALAWVNTMLGNLKRSIHGSYHAVAAKHLPRYLAEFSYRFNRRYDLPSMVPRLAKAALQTPPMPHRLLTMAEAYG